MLWIIIYPPRPVFYFPFYVYFSYFTFAPAGSMGNYKEFTLIRVDPETVSLTLNTQTLLFRLMIYDNLASRDSFFGWEFGKSISDRFSYQRVIVSVRKGKENEKRFQRWNTLSFIGRRIAIRFRHGVFAPLRNVLIKKRFQTSRWSRLFSNTQKISPWKFLTPNSRIAGKNRKIVVI